MKASEIRKKWPSPAWDEKGIDDQLIHYSIRDVLVEIAAQLAELNERSMEPN